MLPTPLAFFPSGKEMLDHDIDVLGAKRDVRGVPCSLQRLLERAAIQQVQLVCVAVTNGCEGKLVVNEALCHPLEGPLDKARFVVELGILEDGVARVCRDEAGEVSVLHSVESAQLVKVEFLFLEEERGAANRFWTTHSNLILQESREVFLCDISLGGGLGLPSNRGIPGGAHALHSLD